MEYLHFKTRQPIKALSIIIFSKIFNNQINVKIKQLRILIKIYLQVKANKLNK